jgi:hypothetical protein
LLQGRAQCCDPLDKLDLMSPPVPRVAGSLGFSPSAFYSADA